MMDKIKNEDLLDKLLKMELKYEKIKLILNDKTINSEKKQEKIEEYCIFEKNIDLKMYVYKSFPKYNKIGDLLKEEAYIKKNPELFDLINYIDNIDAIIMYTFNDIILKYSDDLNISYTKIIIKLSENILIEYKYKYIRDKCMNIKEEDIPLPFNFNIQKNKKIYILMNIIMTYAEKSKILKIFNERINKKTFKKVQFDFDYIRLAYKNYINITNLPMIYKPNDWVLDSNKIGNYGGYLCNKNCNIINLVHYNRDKSKQSIVKKNFLEDINYLQSIKFKIDINQLKYFNNNPEKIISGLIYIKNFEEYKKYHNCDLIYEDNLEKKNAILTDIYKQYLHELNNILLILETLYLADLFKNYTIYFPIYNDFRNRLYYHSYLLNIQGNKVARSLITFSNYNIKDMVSLDATASGFQILGILTKDKKTLKMTNLYGENNIDIYEYYMEKFNNSPLNILENKIKTKKGYIVNITKNKFTFVHRKLFKKILMTYAYNKEVFGMTEDVMEYFHDYKMSRAEVFYHMTNLYKFLEEEFPRVVLLKKLIKEILNKTKNNDIIFNQDSNLISTQFYRKQESQKMEYSYKKQRFSMTLRVDIEPPQYDREKSQRATLPNFIHSIDAHILYQVVHEAKNLGILIYTLHDCFVIPKTYKETIKKIYLEQMQLMYDKNILEKFINDNINDELEKSKIKMKYNSLLNKPNILLNNLNGLKEDEISI